MNLTSRLEKLKHLKRFERSEAEKGRLKTELFSASTCVLLGLVLALGGVGTLALFDFFVWNKIPPELVGFWEIREGPKKDGTIEFFRDGTMEAHWQAIKKPVTIKARVAVRDKKLVITSKSSLPGQEDRDEYVIRELTANTLILEMERGEVWKMVRIE